MLLSKNYGPCIISSALLVLFLSTSISAQTTLRDDILNVLPDVLQTHREFVAMPNVASNYEDMDTNLAWTKTAFEQRNFSVRTLKSTSLPVFLAERRSKASDKTLLIYFHLDGQAVNPANWDQEDPFQPVLKEQDDQGNWLPLSWDALSGDINPEWRMFGRAAADDKAPIMMLLTALDLFDRQGKSLPYNLKVLIDCQEEAGSHGLLSTLNMYKDEYAADYLLIMDGPAHPTNRPTLTFGFRGNATCSITVYGAKLPQHSGHFGNYAPNPVFTLSHLLASMKDKDGRVVIPGYYDGIEMSPDISTLLKGVPDDAESINQGLGIYQPDRVGRNYQESLQYPSLNVRHIETSWKGPGLKTIIPELVTAHLDVRLVVETKGQDLLDKIKDHIEGQGFWVIDRDPTDKERMQHGRIVKFIANPGANAYRTDMQGKLAVALRSALTNQFGQPPVSIRTMGGTIPIVSLIEALNLPTVVVPMVNMDNNQHNPNENIRIGNIIQGIELCHALLSMTLP